MHYFKVLMDIVGLESSDVHLNNFMYAFDAQQICSNNILTNINL